MDAITALAIVAAAASGVVIGALWYSPLMFAGVRRAGIGRTDDELRRPGQAIAMGVLNTTLMAAVMTLMASLLGVADPVDGALAGAVIWLGFVLTTLLDEAIYENRPARLIAVMAGNRLVTLLAMGAVIGLFA